VPVLRADVSTRIGRHPSAVDDDAQDNEANDSRDFDASKNKFDFSVTLDTKEVDSAHQDEEDGDPYTDVDGRVAGTVLIGPEGNGDTSHGQLEWQDDEPVHRIVPAHGESPGGVDKAD